MANTLRSTPAQAQPSVFPSRRVGSQPPTGIAPACLWLLSRHSRLGCGAARVSTRPGAARSRRWSPPTSSLAGFLLLALALGLGAFAAPRASVAVVSALLLVGALGSSAVDPQLAGIDRVAPYGLLATASRTPQRQRVALKRLSDH
jgi:hypothetical protein